MVLYDDKKWLCRLIRTAFTIEDDSGVCEKVLKDRPYLGDQHGGDTSSASSDDSFDIRDGTDMGHRRRSNTAIRLEKLAKQKKAQNLTQFVRVNDSVRNDLTFETNLDYQTEVQERAQLVVNIDELLNSSPHPELIPYAQYAKFEASCHPSTSCKKMSIFITFLPLRVRSYPVKVAVVSTAKIVQLIGLVLWFTSKTHPNVALKTVHEYNLQISDEDGEWDNDFPPMDHQKMIGKFSFGYLALVPAEGQKEQPKQTFSFTFLLPNSAEIRIPLAELQITTLREALNIVFEKSNWGKLTETQVDGYYLEKMGNPSIVFKELEVTLNETKCREFCLVRKGAKSVQAAKASVEASSKQENDMPGGRSELYPVVVTGRFNRVRNAFCVIWGRDRMDLEFQAKTKSYPFSHITGVKLDLTKNRVLVSLGSQTTYTSSSHLQLSTADTSTATDLYNRLKSIIDGNLIHKRNN